MRKRNNPIPGEHQIIRGFADDEARPRVGNWDRNCDGETYKFLDLRHIEFANASLVGTSFLNCDLRGVNFFNSNLSRTNFKGSDLRDANFRVVQILDEVDFENCNLSGTKFGSERIIRGDLNFLSCNWNNTNIEGANFQDRDFILFFLEHRKNPNPSVYIHGTPTFKDARLSGADLRGADLRGVDISGANLSYADLQGANLQGASLEYAELEEANLQGANLQGANLEFAELYDADLRGADLQGASLRSAYYTYKTKGLTDKQKSVMIDYENKYDDDEN